MKIGIDFDNTIICYDRIFHRVAVEQDLIPKDFPKSKEKIRNSLRERNIESKWTEMQGYVYGERITEADPFPGIQDFFIFCRKNKISVNIISHKTRYPYLGKRYDLHQAAYAWLSLHDFFNSKRVGLSREQVFFELTKEDKIQRIVDLRCTHFFDDLPEFLSEKSFPSRVKRILFDPNANHRSQSSFSRVTSWQMATKKFSRLIGTNRNVPA